MILYFDVESDEMLKTAGLSVYYFYDPFYVYLFIILLVGLFIMVMKFKGDIYQLTPEMQNFTQFPMGKFDDILPTFSHSHVDVLNSLIHFFLDLVFDKIDFDSDIEVLSDFIMVVIIDGLEEAKIALDRLVADICFRPLSDNLSKIVFPELF